MVNDVNSCLWFWVRPLQSGRDLGVFRELHMWVEAQRDTWSYTCAPAQAEVTFQINEESEPQLNMSW